LHVGGPLEHQPFVGHLEPRLRHNGLQAALRRRDRDRPAGPRIVNERGGRPFCTISIETGYSTRGSPPVPQSPCGSRRRRACRAHCAGRHPRARLIRIPPGKRRRHERHGFAD
jgi:hypothetical protein